MWYCLLHPFICLLFCLSKVEGQSGFRPPYSTDLEDSSMAYAGHLLIADTLALDWALIIIDWLDTYLQSTGALFTCEFSLVCSLQGSRISGIVKDMMFEEFKQN